jgi:hypothetical protein
VKTSSQYTNSNRIQKNEINHTQGPKPIPEGRKLG